MRHRKWRNADYNINRKTWRGDCSGESSQNALEKRLEANQIALKADLQASQMALKADLQASQIALKADLQASQNALEKRLESSQMSYRNDISKLMNLNVYKIAAVVFGMVFGSITFFESIGIFVQYPWRTDHSRSRE